MKIDKNIQLQGKHQKPILVDLFYKDDGVQKPIVIFCHGYKGFKDWGPWDLVAKEFASKQLFFAKFNFSHNGGTVNQPIDFPDLEAFGNNNYTIELDDLDTVINWLTTNDAIKNDADINSIVLIGHSRGGGIVTIKTSEDKRVKKVISWAGVSDLGMRFPSGKIREAWKENGVAYVENGRTKQQMPHFYQFYQNFKDNEERLNIKNAAKRITVPHLVFHGVLDTSVPFSNAEDIHCWNPKSKLISIKDTDHVFGSKHPWESEKMPDVLNTVVNQSIDFIKTN